jgi:putative oxidoreductase
MKAKTLLFLRIALGLLMVIWGIDKLVDVEHGLRVSEDLYFGAFSVPLLLQAFGLVQIAAGLLICLGLARRFTYPFLIAVTGVTALGVWKSIVDPWGWVLEGTSVLFYPSLIILAGSLVLWAFRAEDVISVDHRRGRGRIRAAEIDRTPSGARRARP